VGDLGPGGPRVVHHGLQHLRRGDDRLAVAVAHFDHVLLDQRHVLRRDVHAQIAAGHHDAVALLDDLLQVLHALAVFDFGDDRLVAAALADHFAHGPHVLGFAHEGRRDHVHAHAHAVADMFLVAFGQGGQVQVRVGDHQAFAGRKRAADDDAAVDDLAFDGIHLELDEPVVQEDGAARPHDAVQVRIADRRLGAVAFNGPAAADEAERLARLQHRAGLHGAHTNFRPLDVQQDANVALGRLRGLADAADALALLFHGAVGKIQPGHVHAGRDELVQDRIGRGPDGAYNLCASHSYPSLGRTACRAGCAGRPAA